MNKLKIYVASKTRHAAKWKALINKGYNIISTWIDEAGPGLRLRTLITCGLGA